MKFTASMIKREIRGFLPYFIFSLLFLWPFLLLRQSFILGDFSAQHFPWAKVYFESLQQNQFPFWTDLMACGFPLAAEGQIGVFYLFNLIVYKTLPLITAYTWSVPFHVWLGGLGIYAYARTIGVSRMGSAVAALVFSFGSGLGGCFYNTGSLRTLSWLGVSLWMMEYLRAAAGAKKLFFGCLLAIFFSQAWNAGFSQMAVYLFIYCLVHEGLAALEPGCPKGLMRWRPLLWIAGAVIAGTLLSLTQFLPTVELIGQSIRKGESPQFAFWGSVPPPALVSLVYPQWGNALRVSFYFGILPLYLVIGLLVFGKNQIAARRQLFLAAFFFLLALGKFNPLYRWAIESLSLTFLRNPAKFLFFVTTPLGVAAGFGLDRLLRAAETNDLRRRLYLKILGGVALTTALLPLASLGIARAAEKWWTGYSRDYVARLVSEKGVLAKSPAHYLKMMEDFFARLPDLFSYANPLNLQTIAVAVTAWLGILFFLRNKISQPVFRIIFLSVLAADLFVFVGILGTGFTGNYTDIKKLETPYEVTRIQKLIKDPSERVIEFVRDPEREFFFPNSSMRYGVAHPGGYSPLLLKDYYDLTYELGIVDGSLGKAPFSLEVWRRERALLDLLGARWVHSDAGLGLKGLEERINEKDFFVYENMSVLPEIAVFYHWKVIPEASARLDYLKSASYNAAAEAVLSSDPGWDPPATGPAYEPGKITARSASKIETQVTASQNAVVWVRLAAYPGWTVHVNGKKKEWFRVNHAFLGFALEPGEHAIAIRYAPTHWTAIRNITILFWMLILGLLGYSARRFI